MRRLLSSVAALAFVLALGAGSAVAKDKMAPAMGGPAMSMTCPKGSSWVKGYTNKKTGKVVKGYCRKGKSKMM